MRNKTWFAGSLAAVLMVGTLLTGCGTSKSSDGKEAASTAAATKEDKLLSFSFYNFDDDWQPAPWGETVTTKWIQENKKVSINYVPTNGNAKQKFNAMYASGDLPDVISLGAGPELDRLISEGQVVPLDQYLDKYSNLKKSAGDKIININRSSDGKLYLIPDWYVGGDHLNGNGGYAVNRKMYKELGSPKLETLADLESYLRTVKEKYPNVIPLEVGNPSAIKMMYSAFKENNPPYFVNNMFYPEGNTIKPITEDPAFKDFMLFTSKLFRDKLMTQDVFTQKTDQMIEKLSQGKVAVAIEPNLASRARVPDSKLKAQDPESGYEFIWPVHKDGLDKNKIFINSTGREGGGKIVITKKAKDPERIFAFLDWATSDEGQSVLWFGPPGFLWDKTDENGIPIPNDKYKTMDKAELDKLHISDNMMAGNATWVDLSKVARDKLLPESQRDFTTTQQVNITWKTAMDTTTFANTKPQGDSEEGIALQAVKDIFDQGFSKMIYAKSDDEVLSVLAKTNDDMKKAGFPKAIDFIQKQWQDNLKKIGGK
ncbi:extracellular solute-binding protein [Paenibacillus aceris]|uniref:Aldouronate transport system substrate-binding protein n=1 Tax=Paenibacillus aceris TaxID=869555 RepID=A0ABS4HWP0_9BACL|nr:extracellular solute-binding protein [Paenibacillus aceris]MBP1963042.1 putative aldouronate transport system substrate-binding protein [Paenibacillus aceris]NHW38456.1 extracellular solute-binding protein [Paenibacillus aceris]